MNGEIQRHCCTRRCAKEGLPLRQNPSKPPRSHASPIYAEHSSAGAHSYSHNVCQMRDSIDTVASHYPLHYTLRQIAKHDVSLPNNLPESPGEISTQNLTLG
ncbi:hypothetical protein NPIL_375741 [Nephila pilipes]|uniref:Uncharacterized protein n=1 Tax=Nephila pilipes TaxID=299642 RepID=A0A8X6MVM9_NEPPI|nr:hypothetical protein NPIL_375741 [Nephila pilipes]